MDQVAGMIIETIQIYAARLQNGPAFTECEALLYEKLCEFAGIYTIWQTHLAEIAMMESEKEKSKCDKEHQQWLEDRSEGKEG